MKMAQCNDVSGLERDAAMPPSFGPLAILNGTCVVALVFILLNMLSIQHSHTPEESEAATIHHHASARLSLKLERFLTSLADVVSPFEEDVWEEPVGQAEEEDETRPVLTHTGYFGGEASLFGLSLFCSYSCLLLVYVSSWLTSVCWMM